MGTAQLAFEVVMWGSATGSDRVRMRNLRWRHWPSPEVTSPVVIGSMFCACATVSCAISVLVGAFWPEVTSVMCPEGVLSRSDLTGSMFCACPRFCLSNITKCSTVVPWLPNVTEGHVTPTSPEAFSHNASLYVIINHSHRWNPLLWPSGLPAMELRSHIK